MTGRDDRARTSATARERPSTFKLDGEDVPFAPGQSILQAALTAAGTIPHLCLSPRIPAARQLQALHRQLNGHSAT
jgi:[NiFe] hydrogenase diaphorase moiety small subunit